jgi:hypothetical protein
MNSAFRLAALLFSLALAPMSASADRHEPMVEVDVEVEKIDEVEMIDLSPAQSVMVRHALGLYAAGGLELPPLVVRGNSAPAGCAGRDGMHHPHGGWSEIELCAEAHTSAVMHTVLHELAHAWAAHELDPERRAEFMTRRGIEHWRNYEHAAWEDNGTEQAAEIIAWAINDKPAALVRIDHVTCGELHDGYAVLTGLEPLHGLTSVCAGVPPVTRS